MAERAPSLLAMRLWAKWQRRQGRYDRATLAAFAALHARSAAPGDLLAWALFRRDLGQPLPRRWVEPLRAGLAALPARRRRLALGLLAEREPAALDGVDPAALADAAARLPAIASRVPAGSTRQALLARIDTEQDGWRAGFAQWLAQRRRDGPVAVVGNAAAMRGSGLGGTIDGCAAVVRFNAFAGRDSPWADIGRRTDVWVVSAGYRGPVPQRVDWVVMSGPDKRYRLQDWSPVWPLLDAGVPVLTVPLPAWRALVRALQRPPSAGVLMLHWLAGLDPAQGWQRLATAGVGSGLASGGRYHVADWRRRPAGRHDWDAERALLRRWLSLGLTALGPVQDGLAP